MDKNDVDGPSTWSDQAQLSPQLEPVSSAQPIAVPGVSFAVSEAKHKKNQDAFKQHKIRLQKMVP